MAERGRKRPRSAADVPPSPSPAHSPPPPTSQRPRRSPLARTLGSPPLPSPTPPLPTSLFSVSAIGRQMRRDRPDCVSRIGSGAPVYMTAVLEYLTHEFIDAAGQQAKKQQQQRKEGRAASTKERDAASPTASGTTAADGPSAVGPSEVVSEPAAAVDDDDDGIDWLAGEPTITPSHLAAVFQDNEDWATVMRDFTTFDQPPTPPVPALPVHSHASTVLDISSQPVTNLSDDSPQPPLPPLLPPASTSQPLVLPSHSPVHSHARRELKPTDEGSSTSKSPTQSSFACSLTTSCPLSLSSSSSPSKPTLTLAATADDRPAVRERGSRHYRPTLRASRGWAGGSKGDAVSRYRPVVRRSADGHICIDNPYA